MASNKNIKGITIEINGDVTKLDKALRSVDQELSKTQSNLKELDRLLKLDPGNVELLDQKQRLLAQSVEQTSKRYETLKKTLEQSTASNVRFDEWTKAQQAFQTQIKKTETELSGLLKQQQQMQSLKFAPNSDQMVDVQTRIDATKAKLQQLQQQSTETYEALGRPISIEQFDALQRELVDSKAQMDNAKKASEDFANGVTDMGNAEAGAGTQTGKLSQLLGAAGISTSALTAAGAIALAAKAIKEFAEWTAGAVKDAANFADEINTLSLQTGFSKDFLQELDYASNLIDVDTEVVVTSMKKLKKNLFSDSADVRSAFDELHIIPEELQKSGMSMEETFMFVVKALSLIEDPLERDRLAVSLFGRNADELAGLIDDAGKKFEELSKYARENGYVLTETELDALGQVDDSFEQLDKTLEMVKKRIAIELAPQIVDLTQQFIEFVKSTNWEMVGQGIASMIRIATPLIIGLATALAGLAEAIAALMNAINGIGSGKIASSGNLYRNDGTLRSSVPGFASGAVVEPNNPMLAVVGDNRTEREVIAPRSELVDATREAIRAEGGVGGSGQLVGIVQFTGTDQEIVRAFGPKLQLLWSDTGASV